MSKIAQISLADAVEFVVDNRGKTAPTQEAGIPLIATNCISNDLLYPTKDRPRFVSQETFDNWFRAHPKPGDIILTNKGSQNGAVCLVPDPVDFCIAQDMVALRANPKRIDPLYLFAALRSSIVQKRIKDLNVDAVIPHFKKTDFNKLFIPLPGRNVQEFIGQSYLGFSSKIELNRQINQTLEQIAQAIFKSWFVDFEPAKAKIEAKAAGRDPERAAMCAISGKLEPELDQLTPEQYQQLAATAAMFPDELVESELGLIPVGWEISTLGYIADIIDCLHSKKPEKQVENTGYLYLQLNNIGDDGLLYLNDRYYISESDYRKWVSRIEVTKGDCVITNVGRVGVVAAIPPGINAAIGRNITAIRLKNEFPYPGFLATLLTSEYLKKEIGNKTDVGTILDALNVKNIPKLQLFFPGHGLLRKFEDLSVPLLRARQSHVAQSEVLASTRDNLLPKLLSGEIGVG